MLTWFGNANARTAPPAPSRRNRKPGPREIPRTSRTPPPSPRRDTETNPPRIRRARRNRPERPGRGSLRARRGRISPGPGSGARPRGWIHPRSRLRMVRRLSPRRFALGAPPGRNARARSRSPPPSADAPPRRHAGNADKRNISSRPGTIDPPPIPTMRSATTAPARAAAFLRAMTRARAPRPPASFARTNSSAWGRRRVFDRLCRRRLDLALEQTMATPRGNFVAVDAGPTGARAC